jgi:hypothetical protein
MKFFAEMFAADSVCSLPPPGRASGATRWGEGTVPRRFARRQRLHPLSALGSEPAP